MIKCKICSENEVLCKGMCRKCYQREYREKFHQRPGVKEKIRDYKRQYYQRPYAKKKKNEYNKKYFQRPGVKERMRKYAKEYNKRPEVMERRRELQREYYQRPGIKEKIKNRCRKRHFIKQKEWESQSDEEQINNMMKLVKDIQKIQKYDRVRKMKIKSRLLDSQETGR